MAERRSSERNARKKSLGGPDVNYNLVSNFTNILQNQPTARRRSSAKDRARTTPSASRKRSGGAGASVTKLESDSGKSVEDLPAFGAPASATQGKTFGRSDPHEDSDLSELGTTPGCPTPTNDQSQETPDLAAQLSTLR